MKKQLATSILLALGLSACSEVTVNEKVTPSTLFEASTSSVPTIDRQTQLQQFGDNLAVRYRLVSNIPDEKCLGSGPCFWAEIDLQSSIDFNHKDWAIYFSQMRPVQSVEADEFTLTHVKGDLYRIEPTAAFVGFQQGIKKTLRFRGELWQLSETDAMPNYYLVSPGLAPVVIASTVLQKDLETGLELRPYVEAYHDMVKQYRRTEADKLPPATAAQLYINNAAVSDNAALAVNSIVPTPQHIDIKANDKSVLLSKGVKIVYQGAIQELLKPEQIAAALTRLARLGVMQSEQGLKVNLEKREGIEGSYLLDITPTEIRIAANDASGFSYGLSTLASLVDVKDLRVNPMTISDSPRYPFRGMHIDVARNFHGKEMIFKLLDQMAAYKLNKLHLHMADDEGWRLEIADLPELTDIGSKRCHDLDEDMCLLPQLGSGPFADAGVNGFYSKQDYIDILQYADARQIQVIPSMDMPGHSRAAIKSMEARYRKLMAQGEKGEANRYLLSDANDKTVYSSVQYYDDNTLNVCMESTYQFVDKVIDEIAKLHQAAGVPLSRYHIGADETAGAWKQSPECLAFIANNDKGIASIDDLGAYFIERISNQLASKGIEAAGWSDGMGHVRPEKMPAKVQSNIWDVIAHKGHERAHKQVNHGWDVILSNPEVLYFDFPYEADPKEHGYYWASRATNAHKVFSFMPDNLAANAEQWTDLQNLPFEADDTVKKDADGKITARPREQGKAFLGIQGQLWSETIRSDDTVEYMIFPRLLMLAERAWYLAEWEVSYQYQGAVYNQNSGFFTPEMRARQAEDWQRLANTLGHKELIKLDKAGIDYRVPTVGATIKDGKLFANIAYPGLKIEYREQNADWQNYQEGVAVKTPLEIRAIAADGTRRGRSLFIEK
ncbi:carbohydate-binding domain-containing protein [Shewanella sp. A25]|nr:carbohydate-binding domain-containing protein [Shewanella shenzhenensis]